MSEVDLRQLAVKRDAAAPVVGARRRLFSRYVLPGGVLLGFVAVVMVAARDIVFPATPVSVVPVLAVRGEVRQEGAPLFQAAGWVEPRPTAVVVPAYAEGTVDRLLVVEGQEVKLGDPVAYLNDRDAALALRTAASELRQRRSETSAARAALQAATTNYYHPVTLQASVAEADNLLAQKENELGALPFLQRAATARLEVAKLDHENKKKATMGSVPEAQLRQAESDLRGAEAVAEELQLRGPRLQREVTALTERRNALRRRLELRADELRQLEDACAMLEAAESRADQAAIAVETAQLRLDRMTVRATMTGRVLALTARPGARVMATFPGVAHEAGGVIALYDPERLQVRADVRLDDVPRVRIGQAVRIETPAAPSGPLEGEVLATTSLADLQKNTLQVKVALKSPVATLRPDMLVQVTFLADAPPKSVTTTEPLRLLVPRNLVETGDGGSRVWLADQSTGVARQKTVKLGQTAGDLVEVIEGLNAGDKIISGGRAGLCDGQRIRVTEEETPPARVAPATNEHKGAH